MSRRTLTPKAKKQLLIITVFAGIFLVGIALFQFTPLEVKRTYNQFATTSDGVSICYDVFEPVNGPAENKPAVILGHGVIVNKEIMRLIALDLAKAGFVAVPFDFRGHGQSSGNVATSFHDETSAGCSASPLENDILAICNYLGNRGDINMTNLGYVGYSMGGGAGFSLISHNNSFNAMVGLAPVPSFDCTNTTNPRNLLLIVGKWDEAIDEESLWKVMENKTGKSASDLELNVTYGNFLAGTAAKFYVDDNSDHLTGPYDINFVVEIRNWMIQALQGTSSFPADLAYPYLLLALVLQVIGGLGFFMAASVPLLQKFARKQDSSAISAPLLVKTPLRSMVAKNFLLILPLSFPCLLIGVLLALTPLTFSGLFISLFIGISVATLVVLWRNYKKSGISFLQVYRGAFHSSARNIGIGFGMGAVFYAILFLSFGNVLGIAPGLIRWGWIPLFFGATFLAFLNIYLFQLPLVQEKLSGTRKHGVLYAGLLNFGMMLANYTTILVVACLLMGSFFLFLAFLPSTILIFLASAVGVVYYSRTKDVILPTIISAIFLTIVIVTLSSYA